MNVTIRDAPEPSSHFVTAWRTSSPNESITIPVGGDDAGSYTIHWGDGTASVNAPDPRRTPTPPPETTPSGYTATLPG